MDSSGVRGLSVHFLLVSFLIIYNFVRRRYFDVKRKGDVSQLVVYQVQCIILYLYQVYIYQVYS